VLDEMLTNTSYMITAAGAPRLLGKELYGTVVGITITTTRKTDHTIFRYTKIDHTIFRLSGTGQGTTLNLIATGICMVECELVRHASNGTSHHKVRNKECVKNEAHTCYYP
jgi:hypothetical protein